MVAFFNCLRRYCPDVRQDTEAAAIVDRLYRRYLRREELDAAVAVMARAKAVFEQIRSADVDWRSTCHVEANTQLDVSRPALAAVFAEYFIGFSSCVVSAESFFEQFEIYRPVRTTTTDIGRLMSENKRPLELYDTLEGEPFWLRGVSLPAAPQGGSGNTFTPEFTSKDGSEFHLVSNHGLGDDEALRLSADFVRARVAFAKLHVPAPAAKFVVHYDVRGQAVAADIEDRLRAALSGVCEVRVLRNPGDEIQVMK
jgi:hypothetical protein